MADYEVGYKKPPIHTRFKKGTSGNASGKAKPATDVLSALEKTLAASGHHHTRRAKPNGKQAASRNGTNGRESGPWRHHRVPSAERITAEISASNGALVAVERRRPFPF